MTSESIFRGHHFYYTEELYILNPYFFTHLLVQDDNIHKHLLILVIKYNNLTHTFHTENQSVSNGHQRKLF